MKTRPFPLKPALLSLSLLSGLTAFVPALAQSVVQSTATRTLKLPIGRSAVIDLPVDASDVFITNPKVAEAVLRTPRRIFVMGSASGQTDAVFYDRMGKQILNLNIHVEANTDQVLDTIKHLYPQSKVEINSLNNHMVLSGMVANAAEASAISKLAATYVSGEDQVVNLMTLAGKQQVLVKVRVVEVDHTAVKQLGFNVSAVFGSSSSNKWSFSQTPSYNANQSYLGSNTIGRTTASSVGGINSLTGEIQAFERAGLLRTLAEPDITTTSGETAKFLAGGEFPVPTAYDTTTKTLTVTYKEYGVGLAISPVVLSNGVISVKVATTVSELSNIGAVTTNGVTLPGLVARTSENTVQVGDGQSIMLAGLLQSKYNASIDSMPGLAALPILGTLFRSRDFVNNQTELVIIMTAYLVSPTDPNRLQTPGDNLVIPNDLEATFLGELNRPSEQGKKTAASAPYGLVPVAPYHAPVGYVIE